MHVPRFIRPIIAACCIVLAIGSCMDKGTEPPPNPLSFDIPALNIVPGTSRTIVVSGGTPPYYIIQYPVPQVGTASFEDSTVSPANLVIHALTSATIDDEATVTVGDSPGDVISLPIKVVAVGDISYSDDIQPIWDANCQNRGCHPGNQAPFSLDRFVSYNNLYSTVASNMSCGAVFRVVPGSPDSSLLWLVLSGKSSCPRMPLSPLPGDTLSLQDQIKVYDWIDQGAENN